MKIHPSDNSDHSRRIRMSVWVTAWVAVAIIVIPGTLRARQTSNSQSGQSNPVTIGVQIDKREAQIAEQIQLTITATAPENVSVSFPDLQMRLGEFEVTGVKDTLDIPTGADRTWIRRVGLESLVSGELEIPGIEVSYVDRRGSDPRTGHQSTPAQQVTIRSTLEGVEDPTQFRDIKSVMFAPVPQTRSNAWWVAIGVAAGSLCVAALALVLARRKTELSPRQWAIRSLDELQESRAFQDNDAEQIYVRLVSTLRTFIDWQFGISAPHMTTNEFLDAMQADDRLTGQFRADLSDLLNFADQVKFAGMLPEGNQLTLVVDQARRLVEHASETGIPSLQTREFPTGISTSDRTFQNKTEDKPCF